MTEIKHLQLSDLAGAPLESVRMDSRAPYSRSRDGYGPKIATRYWVRVSLTDKKGRKSAKWLRVWCACYSNSGSLYVVKGGQDYYLSSDVEWAIETVRDAHYAAEQGTT